MDIARLTRLATLPLLITVVGLTLVLLQRVDLAWDLSDRGRNSLSAAQQTLLEALDGPIEITAFTRDLPVQRGRAANLVERLRRAKPDVRLEFVDPVVEPERARAAGIEAPGQWLIRYRDRSETRVTPTLAAVITTLERLARTGAQWIVEIERSGAALLGPRGVTTFGRALEQRGYRIVPLSLLQAAGAPDNTALLVLSGASTALKPVEASRLLDYVQAGGNLLWLSEDLEPADLAGLLGIEPLPGTIVDAAAAGLQLERPDFAVTRPAPGHPLGGGFEQAVVLPQARALRPSAAAGWRPAGDLRTGAQSWNETGALTGDIRREPLRGELSGPLTPALLLSRDRADGGVQRVAVIGDVDLFSDLHLGREANLPFGLALVRWLTDNEHLGAGATAPDADARFDWDRTTGLWVSTLMLAGLPLLLLLTGVVIRMRRATR